MTAQKIVFVVGGIPIPQGSTKSFGYKKKNGKIGVSTTHANDKTMPWRGRIATEAQATRDRMVDKFYVPKSNGKRDGVIIEILFFLPRPKSIKKDAVPTKRPDLDKLIRAVLDGLTGILFDDDSQVLTITAHKYYTIENDPPYAAIRVEAIE